MVSKTTLKQVKDYFKNAKEVRCLYDGEVYSFEKMTEKGIYDFINCFWFDIDEKDVLIYDDDFDTFAKIISYKENDIEVKDAEILTPKHYDNNNGYDVIDIAKSYNLNFNRGNVIKYVCRAGKKDDELKDLKKALDYIQREIKFLEND